MLPRSRPGALIVALVLGWGILGVVNAAAAPPGNDDFSNAREIGALPFEHITGTRDATSETTDPNCFGRRHTVWYSFTPLETGSVVGSTAGSDFDTTLSVYTGTRPDRTRIKCDDDSGPGSTSLIRFKAVAGQTYHFMAGSYRRSGGRLTFGLIDSPPLCFGLLPTILGTSGDDVIEGTTGRDVIVGLEGNDVIVGNGGQDSVCGNDGNDSIEGAELAKGNEGDDSLSAALAESSRLWGGDGNDIVTGEFGSDNLFGGQGDDVMRGNEGFDTLQDFHGSNEFYGGTGSDQISPGRSTAVVVGGPGPSADFLFYFLPSDISGVAVDLAAGTVLVEGTFPQTVHGIEGAYGTRGSDTFIGSDGRDVFLGLGGIDTMIGAAGDDYLRAEAESGSATIWGSEGDDYIEGSFGDDQLSGDAGDDELRGWPGDDNLDGGDGIDGLDGGQDSDSCVNGERIINCE